MKHKFAVWAAVHVTKFLGVFEAESEEDAEQTAMDVNGDVSLCFECGEEMGDPVIDHCIVEELWDDGAPSRDL